MIEAIANSAEDYLISGLDFRISPSASYITDRKSVTFVLPVVVKIIFRVKGHDASDYRSIRKPG